MTSDNLEFLVFEPKDFPVRTWDEYTEVASKIISITMAQARQKPIVVLPLYKVAA